MLTLKKAQPTRPIAISYLADDPYGRPPTKDDPIEATNVIVFHVRPLNGHDMQEINDTVMEGRAGKKMRVLSGSVMRLQIMRAVVGIEGLQDEGGNAVGQMTETVFNQLPAWMLTKLSNEITGFEPNEDELGN